MIYKIIKNRLSLWIILIVAVTAITGCVIKTKDGGNPAAEQKKVQGFGHKIHIEGGAACKSCHMTASKKDKAGMPNEMLCGFCHKTVYNDQPVSNYYKKKEWEASHNVKRAKYDEINFSHSYHFSMGVTCETCHDNVGASVQIQPEHIPVKATCFTCHSDWNNKENCSVCHKVIRYDEAPPSHKQGNFTVKHGQIFREESSHPELSQATSPSCKRCHTQDHCIKCHQEHVPSNHTNQWRLIGHGITAGIDRDKCTTCHKTDFCARCHENTRPQSHSTVAWGNPSNRHCESCHLPLNSTSCNLCHKNVAAHTETMPGSHVSGWGNPINKHCANCHTQAATCSVCHDGTPSHKEVPPSSHTGQWGSPKNNHCVRCHIPISRSVTCKNCHNNPTVHFEEAPLRPNDLPHTRALMCRACHQTGTPTLSHPDNGLECRICHKQGG